MVPEVNPDDIGLYTKKGIIANPNCSTIQMVVALKPIYDAVGIRRVVVTTFQAVSGPGKKPWRNLLIRRRPLNFKEPKIKVYPHQIAFNCLPQIDVFVDNGYTKEEMKMINETKKIMGDDSIAVTATTVRVPVFRCHSESVNIETDEKISCRRSEGTAVPGPRGYCQGQPLKIRVPAGYRRGGLDETFVGRIREDESIDNGINIWVVSDNLRKGAALNAVQIAEILIQKYLK